MDLEMIKSITDRCEEHSKYRNNKVCLSFRQTNVRGGLMFFLSYSKIYLGENLILEAALHPNRILKGEKIQTEATKMI